jgi:poly [ADP-ribose] polymerase
VANIKTTRLIFSDVVENNNKFWTAEMREDYSVYVAWGRVGDVGQNQTKSFPSQSAAERFFESKKREKLNKGYTEQKTLETGTTVTTKPASANLAEVARKQIVTNNPITEKLVVYLAQVNAHSILESTTMTFDVSTGLFSTPLGIVTKDGIDEARALLVQIGDFVSRQDFRNPAFPPILSHYLRIIPQKTSRRLSPETLYPDLDSVQKQNSVLDSLEGSLEIALKQPAKQDGKTVDTPQLFAVKLHLVEDGREIDRIRKKYKQTLSGMHACAHLDVKQVYNVEIDHMSKAYKEKGAKLGNEQELWHGTRAGNLLSMMKSGFVIPPSNASHCTGRMFGNGVYFSDQSTKSLNYAYGYWGGGGRDNNCFMLLNRVAMGKAFTPSGPSSNLPKPGYDSTFAVGGKSGVANNEMIVYRTNQIEPTHLIEFSPGGR